MELADRIVAVLREGPSGHGGRVERAREGGAPGVAPEDRVDEALDTIAREREVVAQGGDSELMEILQDKNPAEQYRLEVFEDG